MWSVFKSINLNRSFKNGRVSLFWFPTFPWNDVKDGGDIYDTVDRGDMEEVEVEVEVEVEEVGLAWENAWRNRWWW